MDDSDDEKVHDCTTTCGKIHSDEINPIRNDKYKQMRDVSTQCVGVMYIRMSEDA